MISLSSPRGGCFFHKKKCPLPGGKSRDDCGRLVYSLMLARFSRKVPLLLLLLMFVVNMARTGWLLQKWFISPPPSCPALHQSVWTLRYRPLLTLNMFTDAGIAYLVGGSGSYEGNCTKYEVFRLSPFCHSLAWSHQHSSTRRTNPN